MVEMTNEYQKIRVFTHCQPNHISPAELASLLHHIGNIHPMQFVVEMTHHYNKLTNETIVEIITTSEKFPGQFSYPRPASSPYNG